MLIKRITLDNFRVYKGVNEVAFDQDGRRNVHIISGYNGYGKTTFLTSLVWCLYGNQMQEVDDTFRRRIRETGGYPRFLESCMNRSAAMDMETTYSVSVVFANMEIPGITANEVLVKRSYKLGSQTDQLEIFIDGNRNELVMDVGYEIFIQDFILPKEIAKFFFFDAEKITSLAENQNLEQKRQLGRAYAEVLGIKKYVDLRSNLVVLRLKYRKESASALDTERIQELEAEIETLERGLAHQQAAKGKIDQNLEEIQNKLLALQTNLLRAGNTTSVEELEQFYETRKALIERADQLKGYQKELLELAPFAIAASLFFKAVTQAETEQQQREASVISTQEIDTLTKQVEAILHSLPSRLDKNEAAASFEPVVKKLHLWQRQAGQGQGEERLFLSKDSHNELMAIAKQLKHSYTSEFKRLAQEMKRTRYELNEVTRSLSHAESKGNDATIKHYKERVEGLLITQQEVRKELDQVLMREGVLQNDVNNRKKVLAEFQKKLDVKADLHEKDEVAQRLIAQLDEFIKKIQQEKRHLLEESIRKGLNSLMHKKHFVKLVSISIEEEIIEIDLIGDNGDKINKEDLSMGEKQLYATAIFQALVKESKIEFPVFIDSPMQKLDRTHAENILSEFYPNVSKQVVILPLLHKEISAAEYLILEPFVKSCHLIEHHPELDSSRLVPIENEQLYQNMVNYYQNSAHV